MVDYVIRKAGSKKGVIARHANYLRIIYSQYSTRVPDSTYVLKNTHMVEICRLQGYRT